MAAALEQAGYDVGQFTDTDAAWDAIVPPVELLITRIQFAAGKPHGIALASRARTRGIKVLFVALPQYAKDAEGLGAFLPMPVSPSVVVAAVQQLIYPG
jgi:DNA-binding response OmpR family regulator